MAAEIRELIGDGDSVWRQIFEPRMLKPYPLVSGAAYPSQFQFKQNDDGRRVESVVWKQRSSVEACHKLGVDKARSDSEKKLAQRPDTPPEELPTYVGFFGVSAARIRGVPHLDGRICEPDVFQVEHEPENGVYAHSHIVLSDDFTEIMRRSMVGAVAALADRLNEKTARQHAINMLVGIFEMGGLTRHAA